jgi:hypothetical protein
MFQISAYFIYMKTALLDMNKIFCLALLLILIYSCSPKQDPLDAFAKASTEYSSYNGFNLKVIEKTKLDCEGCYLYRYEFEVDSQRLPEYVYGYRVAVSYRDGKFGEPTTTRLETDVKSFDDCVKYGYEVKQPCSSCQFECTFEKATFKSSSLPG